MIGMGKDIRVVLANFTYTEAPRWHGQRLWFSDLYSHRVLSANEDGTGLRVEAEVPHQPAGIDWLSDGRLLVVSMLERKVLRRELDGSLVVHADLSAEAVGPLNDIAVDRQGRAFVGDFGFDLFGGDPLASAHLYRIDPDGACTTVADDLWFPNGCVVTDGGKLLVSETFGNRITASISRTTEVSPTDRSGRGLGNCPPK